MTVDEAWQEYAHKTIPMTKDGFVNHTTTFIYPLAGVMYKTFVAGWEAAQHQYRFTPEKWQEAIVVECAKFADKYVSESFGVHYSVGDELKKHFGVKDET